MLLTFTVSNYKVFKEKNTFDLRATSLSELQDSNVTTIHKERMLKSIAIYGKNASGKSNLLAALEFMSDFVVESSKDRQSNELIEIDPFRLSTAHLTQPSYFEITFLLNDNHYRYGFEVNEKRVVKEWLFERPKTKEYPLFLRIEDEFQINSKRFPEGRNKEGWTRKNALFLSLVAQLNGQLSQNIINWVDNWVFIHNVCNCDWEYENKTEALLRTDEKYKEVILDIIRKADVDIDDIEVVEFNQGRSEKMGKTIQSDEPNSSIYTYHRRYNAKNEVVDKLVRFNLEEDASDGTIRLFNLVGFLIEALEHNSVVFLDEIDSRLHTLLSKAIVLLFNSDKNKQAQFIFTTHDTNLLDKDLLRRDQIYFVEKNRFGAAKIYSLADFKIKGEKVRKDADYETNYLRGRYGAIPFINEF